MILASAMVLGASVTGWSQGFEDDFAQDWVAMEEDAKAIELAGHFSPHVAACDGCDSGCDSCCGPASCAPTCCPPWWAHRSGLMGQWLYLRPGNTDIIYTIEQNNVGANSFPTGPVGYAAIDTSSGVRAGINICATDRTSLALSFTHWEGDDQDLIDATAGNVLVSEVLHPSRINTGATGQQETASYGMDFQLADLAYRHLWRNSDRYAINWKAGLQYGNMEQEFRWDQTVPASAPNGTFSVDSDIDFDGFGLMAGLDFERHSCRTGLSIYGKGTGSALAGEWNADYEDTAQTAGGVVANDYKDFRITPLVELELGLAWQSKCGRGRINAGYMTSAWYNALSSRSYIDAVREGRFIDVDETITFSGLVLGGEYRF